MRIFLVADRFPPYDENRSAQLAAEVVRGLQQRGHAVQVLAGAPPRRSAQVMNEVHFALEPDVDKGSRWSIAAQFLFQRKRRSRRNLAYCQQVLADFKPDIILLWNLDGWHRGLSRLAEQTLGVQAVHFAADASPVQPDAYSAYWIAFRERREIAPLRKIISRVALRQIRRENHGILRLDFVLCADDAARRALRAVEAVPVEAIALSDQAPEQRLDEIEAILNRARAHRRLGAPLSAARSSSLLTLKQLLRRPIRPTAGWHTRLSDDEHLALAAQWLTVAQDAAGDGGLAQLYHTIRREWTPAYPETTGYAIPTLLHYARVRRDEQLRERVQRMAQYLLSVQLANGAVPIVHNDPHQVVQPCAFDVGQVIYGYLAAYREFGGGEYLEAARRAGDWLIRDQEPDGRWVRFTYNNVAHAWEVRVSWALLQLAQAAGDERYTQAARRNLAWTLAQQQADGWFDHLALTPGEAAVMHTIAYTLEGLLECGLYLNNEQAVQAVCRPADVLLAHQRDDGSLPGAFVAGWRRVDHFSCLTGNAQMAIVWLRLYQWSGDEQYLNAAGRAIDFVCRSQLVCTRDRDVRGSVPGSVPLSGDYLPYSLPNWAAKFFMDAVLLGQTVRRAGRAAAPPPR